jgi:geranylgeranyl diphosphate synthase type I
LLYHRNEPLADTDLARAAVLIEKAGAREWTEAHARTHLSRARRQLEQSGSTGHAVAGFAALASLIARQYQ